MKKTQYSLIYLFALICFSSTETVATDTCADQLKNYRHVSRLLKAGTIWHNRDTAEPSKKDSAWAQKKIQKFYNNYIFAYDMSTGLIEEEVASYLNTLNTEGPELNICDQLRLRIWSFSRFFISKKNNVLEIENLLTAARERSEKILEAKKLREDKKKIWQSQSKNVAEIVDQVTISALEYQYLLITKSQYQSLQGTLQEMRKDDDEERNAESRI